MKLIHAWRIIPLLMLVFVANSATAQVTWTGNAGDGFWSTDGNWDFDVAPTPEAVANMSFGTASWERVADGGDFLRSADTNLTGSASLDITNSRFLNANPAPFGTSTFTMNTTGTLSTQGDYFIVGTNGIGSLVQQAGTVTASVNRGFFLSDGASVGQGTYELTGGELNVEYTGFTSDFHSELLGRGGNDTFHIDGGAATFTSTNSDNRRLYLLRNSQFTIDSGSATFNDFKYFVIGRNVSNEAEIESSPTLTVNGGEFDVNFLSGVTVGFVVGGNGTTGTLNVNGGEVNIAGASMWIGDGGAAGYVNQTDGNIWVEGDVVIGRSTEETFDQYTMSGGTLIANNLVQGSDATSMFSFTGGTITLNGDQTGLLSQSWFDAAQGTVASYNSSLDTTLIQILDGQLGDFNADGIVDIADYAVWRNNLGADESNNALNGNGNGGTVSIEDFNLWKQYFGTDYSQNTSAAVSAAVPEPSSLIVMIGLSACGLAFRRQAGAK